MKNLIVLLLSIWMISFSVVRAQGTESVCSLSKDFRSFDNLSMPCGIQEGMFFEKFDYPDLHAQEWQIRLEAPAPAPSTIYENLSSADFILEFPDVTPIDVHWSHGSHASPNDFQPKVQSLNLGSKPFLLESFGGRSSDGCMPYFNIANGTGGLIVAVGWPGDWKASFELVAKGKVRITAGLKRSHFKLRVGEVVRLPSILIMSYHGDWLAGQNRFRQLMLRHFTPKNHDPMVLMPVAASIHGMIGFNDTTETNIKEFADRVATSALQLDTIWLDAGWNQGGFPGGQGNHQADSVRYPTGLKSVGQTVKQLGKRFLVWFEPERAMRETWLQREHPEWLLKPSRTPESLRYMEKDGFHLVDFGNPEARTWAINTISAQIQEASIEIYRQDFNEYPSYFWHTDEQPDEIGLREIRYVNGLYDFLDELIRRHPTLIIDNCASGGRRLDFEMMRRSVCLWRSDSCWDDKTYPRNVQSMNYGLSLWLPLHGLGSVATDPVSLRSGMGACASFAINYRDAKAVEDLRSFLVRYRLIRPLFSCDFYPLTAWTEDVDSWIAFQYNNADKHEGIVQAFVQSNHISKSVRLRLKGLDRGKGYLIRDWDKPDETVRFTGSELMDTGIMAESSGGSTARVFHYGPLKGD